MRKILHIPRFENWRFLQLSLLFVALMFVAPMLGEAWLLKTFLSFAFLNSIFVVFRSQGAQLKRRRFVLVLWGCVILFSLGDVLTAGGEYFRLFESLEIAATSLLMLCLIYEIMNYISQKGEVTLDSIFAALSVYLMLALFFALLYTFLYNMNPDSFRFSHADSISSFHSSARSNMLYFSMVTLATLGYGDIVPFSNYARMLSVIESVAGQFFVAVIVAILVGKMVVQMEQSGGGKTE
jgi:hypothetical protein